MSLPEDGDTHGVLIQEMSHPGQAVRQKDVVRIQPSDIGRTWESRDPFIDRRSLAFVWM
jgi:hypothetical protein